MTAMTREAIITAMCFTSRHDYGLNKLQSDELTSGMTEQDRSHLWNSMAQIFDNAIAPHMDFKHRLNK